MITLRSTARLTGLAYLGLAVCGLIGFLLIRRQLYVPGDAATTAANLVGQEGLARLGIAADLGVVLTQALAALGFFVLFRRVDGVAAGSVAAFGLVNAVVVLVATAFSATALEVAIDATSSSASDALLLYDLNAAAWRIGGLFFGLWLIPMGLAARNSGYLPRALGLLLVVGGIGYILSTFLAALAPTASGVADALVLPATVGEFWMIGHLLTRGGASIPDKLGQLDPNEGLPA
jgi:hypothetical protein